MELIDKQKAISIASGYCHWSNIPKELEKLPTVQAVPIEVLQEIRQEILNRIDYKHHEKWVDEIIHLIGDRIKELSE